MAKKPQPEFTVPPESITQGGSYVVDPATGKVERMAFTEYKPAVLDPAPAGPDELPAIPTTQATE